MNVVTYSLLIKHFFNLRYRNIQFFHQTKSLFFRFMKKTGLEYGVFVVTLFQVSIAC